MSNFKNGGTIHGAKLAEECFLEILKDYAMTDGEKNNLYNGLRALAQEVQAISELVHAVDAKLDLMLRNS